MSKGKYIVLEGTDGSGKSTQSKLLAEWLEREGKKVRAVREHTWGKIGTLLRREYLEKDIDLPLVDLLLYSADRLELMEQVILPAISEGSFVVSDRNYVSSFGYQGANGVNIEWIRSVNKHMMQPDIVIIVDTHVEDAVKRVKGEDKFEVPEVQRRVKEMYDKMEEILPNHNIVRVDGNRSIEEIHEDIKNIVLELMEN